MNIYDTTFDDELEDRQIDVRFHYQFTPGRPAYTPRGEYAPIDPPEPPEIGLEYIEIRGVIDGKLAWIKPSEALNRLLWSWYESDLELQEKMIYEAERWHGPDPDDAYDAWKEREWDK